MYLDASAIEEVPLDLWRDVFATIGWPASLGDKQTHLTHDDVREAVRTDDLEADLLYALEILHTLGTEAGREAIVSIMSEGCGSSSSATQRVSASGMARVT